MSRMLEEMFSSRGRVKVVRAIVVHGALNVNRICKITGLHHRIVRSHLKSLIESGIVSEERFGRVKIYSLNNSNPKVKRIVRLIEALEA